MNTDTLSNIQEYRKYSLVDILTQQIRQNIFTGKYPPDSRLVIRDLSEEFNVSHTPIKEALNRLVSEGFIESIPRRGMKVKMRTPKELVERMEVRLMCELYCVDSIMYEVKTNPAFMEMMEQVQNNFNASKNTGIANDYDRWMDLEHSFHVNYIKTCRNQSIVDTYLNLNVVTQFYGTYMRYSTPLSEARFQQNIEENRMILDSFYSLDKERIQKTLTMHIKNVLRDFINTEYVYSTHFWQKVLGG